MKKRNFKKDTSNKKERTPDFLSRATQSMRSLGS